MISKINYNSKPMKTKKASKKTLSVKQSKWDKNYQHNALLDGDCGHGRRDK